MDFVFNGLKIIYQLS